MNINIKQAEKILCSLDDTFIIFSISGDYVDIVCSSEEQQSLIGKNVRDTIAEETAQIFLSKIQEAAEKEAVIDVEYQVSELSVLKNLESDNSTVSRFFRAKVIPFRTDDGEAQVIWASRDVTDYKIMEKNFTDCAIEDPVTGIYNRRYFFKELNNFFQRFKRGSNEYSVIMITLDSTEKISASFGADAAESIMDNLLSIMKDTLRSTDLFANSADEEFFVLLPDTPSKGASMMSERLRSSIEHTIYDIDGEQYSYTASFGCSMVSDKDTSYENVINRAEIAVYQAKHNGGNSVKRLDFEQWNKDNY